MKLTEVQKSITRAIDNRSVTNITSFFAQFCELEIKDTIGILDNVHIYYLSLNPQKNHALCQEFMILLDKLCKHDLISLSPDEIEERFLVFTSEDGDQPAIVDTKLMKIISSHLDAYAEDINSIGQGFSVSKEIIALPELADFIANDFFIVSKTSAVNQLSSDIGPTGVNKIDEMSGVINAFKKRPVLTGWGLLGLIVISFLSTYFAGFWGEKGKQAVNGSPTERAHYRALKPAMSLRMSDELFNLDASFSFRNAGNTDATKIRGFAKLVLSDGAFEPVSDRVFHRLDSTLITQVKSVRLRNEDMPFRRQSWAVEHDSLFIYIFGKIDYRDVFDKWHWTEFAFRYNYGREEFQECCNYNNGN